MKEVMDRSLWARSSGLDKESSTNFGLFLCSGKLNRLDFGDISNRDSQLGLRKSYITQFLEK